MKIKNNNNNSNSNNNRNSIKIFFRLLFVIGQADFSTVLGD